MSTDRLQLFKNVYCYSADARYWDEGYIKGLEHYKSDGYGDIFAYRATFPFYAWP